MSDINTVLEQNSFAIKSLLRRSRILGDPNMESIQKGFEKHGEQFMMKVLQIITPTQSSFTELITPKSAVLTSSPANNTLMPINTTTPAAATTGKGWLFWNSLLAGINSTGEALGKFKTDLTGSTTVPVSATQAAKDASNTKTLYMVAAAIVALIVIILIVKK